MEYWLIFAVFFLAVIASFRACHLYEGAELPLWLLLIWIVPVMGSILCFLVNPISAEKSEEKKVWQEFLDEMPHRKHLNKDEREQAFEKWLRLRESDQRS